MRHAVLIAAMLTLSACGSYRAVQNAEKVYTDCLDAKPADQCTAERAAYDKAVARNNSRPPIPQQPLVLKPWTPPPPVQGPTQQTHQVMMPNGRVMNCTTYSGTGMTQCH